MKKKLDLNQLQVRSFVTQSSTGFKKTVKGGNQTNLWSPCAAGGPSDGCQPGGGGGGNYTGGCASYDPFECPTVEGCASRPPACSNLFAPCNAHTHPPCTV